MPLTYAVVRNGPYWSIEHENHLCGRFAVRSDAIEEADRLAREAEALGHPTRLLVQG